MGKKFLIFVAVVLLVVYAAAIPRGHSHGRMYETAILSEIDQLHNAVQAYKEKYIVYPPCMAVSDTNVRKVKFMQHLRTVYPSSAYGVRVVDFDILNAYVGNNYHVSDGKGGVISLDLMKLDPAEAMPFWLGGFPTPADPQGQPIAPTRVFGFHVDSDSPIKRSPLQLGVDPLWDRTNPRFDFRQERLVDQDGDGWWEYVPTPPSVGTLVAPFVYFDFDYYGSEPKLPSIPYPTDPVPATQIGTVVPLAKYVDPNGENSTVWQNPQSFQILCGGLDGKYSAPNAPLRISVFPTGKTYPGPNFTGSPTDYDDEEFDNLTNLIRTSLGVARSDDLGETANASGKGGQSIVVPFFVCIFVASIVIVSVYLSAKSQAVVRRSHANEQPDFSRVVERR
jgi:hypothetical protein